MRTGRHERVRPRLVQRSAKWLNRTQGPVRRSQYFLLNRTEPDFRITITSSPYCDFFFGICPGNWGHIDFLARSHTSFSAKNLALGTEDIFCSPPHAG